MHIILSFLFTLTVSCLQNLNAYDSKVTSIAQIFFHIERPMLYGTLRLCRDQKRSMVIQ